MTPAAIAFFAGVWALAAQFIYNRIIFFYVANSEYVAALIISLHLAGFVAGNLAGARIRFSTPVILAAALSWFAGVWILVWVLGGAIFGLPATVAMTILAAIGTALLCGLLLATLMRNAPDARAATRLMVADGIGSILGALIGGFVLIPLLGLQTAFASLMLLLAGLWIGVTKRLSIAVVTVLAAGSLLGGWADPRLPLVRTVDGLPLETHPAAVTQIFSQRSPYGVVGVTDEGSQRWLRIDNRRLCHVDRADPQHDTGLSEWALGEYPALLFAGVDNPRIANIGLGCGTTLAAMQTILGRNARLDVIEINAVIQAAQKLFGSYQPAPAGDPRVRVVLSDGFRYFADMREREVYDVIALDVAWMQNMNATHLFSEEMYRNVERALTRGGVFSVWSEETSPFSRTALIIYKTLASVFPEVLVDATQDTVVFYALRQGNPEFRALLTPEAPRLAAWMEEASKEMPVNRLDDLKMNRSKFTVWGDSTYERLWEFYKN